MTRSPQRDLRHTICTPAHPNLFREVAMALEDVNPTQGFGATKDQLNWNNEEYILARQLARSSVRTSRQRL